MSLIVAYCLQVGLLKELRMLCAERRADIAVEVRTSAMTAFVEVIKDIAPRLDQWVWLWRSGCG